MTDKKIKVIKTKTYLDSLYKLKDNSTIVAIEKKVNKLLENPAIAKPMKYGSQNFCEIKVEGSYRVYAVRIDGAIIVFILGPAIHHKGNYQKSKEYLRLFEELERVKEEFKDKV